MRVDWVRRSHHSVVVCNNYSEGGGSVWARHAGSMNIVYSEPPILSAVLCVCCATTLRIMGGRVDVG